MNFELQFLSASKVLGTYAEKKIMIFTELKKNIYDKRKIILFKVNFLFLKYN